MRMYAGQRRHRGMPSLGGDLMNSPNSQQPVPNGAAGRRCQGCGAGLATDNTARLCGRCHREQRDQLRTPLAHLRNEFFEAPEFRAAFVSQDIGKVFKAYRNHLGICDFTAKR